MDTKDIYVSPLIIVLIFGLFHFLFIHKRDEASLKCFFYGGLSLKVCAALALGLIYQFYYNGLDTFEYFQGGLALSQAIKTNFGEAFYIYTHAGSEIQGHFCSLTGNILDKHILDPNAFFFIKIVGLLSLVTYDNYLSVAFLLAGWSFLGNWALFKVLVNHLKLNKKIVFGVLFGFPLVLLWGSGLIKDSLVWGAFCFLLANLYLVFFNGFSIFRLLKLLLLVLLIAKLKVYLLLALIPVLMLSLLHHKLLTLNWNWWKILLIELGISFTAFIILLQLPNFLGGVGVEDTADQLFRMINNGQQWNARQGQRSAYSFLFYEPSLWGLIKLFPQAVVVSLYRPFIWECQSSAMYLSAVESLGLFAFSLFVMVKSKFNFWLEIWKDTLLYFIFLFVIAYAFFIGIATYNFGALSRYRIPILSIYFLVLYISYMRSKKQEIK